MSSGSAPSAIRLAFVPVAALIVGLVATNPRLRVVEEESVTCFDPIDVQEYATRDTQLNPCVGNVNRDGLLTSDLAGPIETCVAPNAPTYYLQQLGACQEAERVYDEGSLLDPIVVTTPYQERYSIVLIWTIVTLVLLLHTAYLFTTYKTTQENGDKEDKILS